MLQARVRTQMEGLRSAAAGEEAEDDKMAARKAIQTLVMPVVAKNNNG